jgi:hypothetical protein
LDIICDADNELYEENLLVVTDAYQCLTAIVSFEKGEGFLVLILNRILFWFILNLAPAKEIKVVARNGQLVLCTSATSTMSCYINTRKSISLIE